MHKVIKDGNNWERCYINLQSCLQAQSRYTNTSQYFIVHTRNKVLLTIIDNVAGIGNAVYYIIGPQMPRMGDNLYIGPISVTYSGLASSAKKLFSPFHLSCCYVSIVNLSVLSPTVANKCDHA